jgi:DNA repair protein RadC
MEHMPAHRRPREKLIAHGAAHLTDVELVAILLRTGTKKQGVLDLARTILRRFPLSHIERATYADLTTIHGIEAGKACTILAAFEIALRARGAQHATTRYILSAEDMARAAHHIATKKKEHTYACYMNARGEVVHDEVLSVGTLDASILHPRDVFAPALTHHARSVALAHNHPSGDPTPSPDDRAITLRLRDAAELLGITLLAHVVVAGNNWREV